MPSDLRSFSKILQTKFFLELHEVIVLAAYEGGKRLYHGRKGEACGGWTIIYLNFGGELPRVPRLRSEPSEGTAVPLESTTPFRSAPGRRAFAEKNAVSL